MIQFSEYARDRMHRSLTKDGDLRVVIPSRYSYKYGEFGGDPITARPHDISSVRHMALNPEMALGEANMNRALTIDGDKLQGVLGLIVRSVQRAAGHRVWWQKPPLKFCAAFRRLAQNDLIERARGNVAHQYDLSGCLYDFFLDDDRRYS